MLWLVSREAYWRFGNGRRIGIAYSGYKVDRADWASLSGELKQLFRESPAARQIHVRHVPAKVLRNDESWTAFQSKYKFEAVLKISISASIKDKGEPIYQADLTRRYSDSLRQEMRDHAEQVILQLGKEPTVDESAYKVLELRASGLFNTVLVFIAVQEFANGRFADASRCLHYLDERLKSRFPKNHSLRLSVRWLDTISLLEPSAFEPDKPPVEQDLLHARESALLALERYGTEFPNIHHLAARTLFYCRDIDAAFRITQQAASVQMPELLRASNMLNLGVLSLFRSNWVVAVDRFSDLFAWAGADTIDFPALVAFADFARDYGFDAAVYLQVLYRTISGIPVSADMTRQYQDWLGDEPSKSRLLYLSNELARKGIKGYRLQTATSPKMISSGPKGQRTREVGKQSDATAKGKSRKAPGSRGGRRK